MTVNFEDEFIYGKYLNCIIEAFIVHETKNEYGIVIHNILEENGPNPTPSRLKKGAFLLVSKELIDEDVFVKINKDMQKNIISLAEQLGQKEFALELVKRYHNPYREGTKEFEREIIEGKQLFSTVLKTYIRLDSEDKKTLFNHYKKAVEMGLSDRFEHFEDINSAEALDAAIGYIVFGSMHKEGIEFLKNLIRRAKRLSKEVK